MAKTYFDKEKQFFLENCTQCGICAAKCPVLQYTEIKDQSPEEIQKAVYRYLQDGKADNKVFVRAFSCMECFKCTVNDCPQGLNPLLINELVKKEYKSKQESQDPLVDEKNRAHKITAELQLSAEEYSRITTPVKKKKAKYLFFPGCNVYFQPEKILNTLDLLDLIGDEYAFLPGLDNCCGDRYFFTGDLVKGIKTAEHLIACIEEYQIETVLLWCPTCLCRFDSIIKDINKLPFKVLSISEYILNNIDKLSLSEPAAKKITLHEACKSAYTGLDNDAPRKILKKIPGLELQEMKHHKNNALCCGSGAISWFPESYDEIRNKRLNEAEETKAECLVTVCHFCEQSFVSQETDRNFHVSNYINLLCESIGIHREDKFRKYTSWCDIDRILNDSVQDLSELGYEQDEIVKVLQSVFNCKNKDELN